MLRRRWRTAARRARIIAELSTLSLADKLAFAATLEAAGHVPLDCPLSGTGSQAEIRDLVIYASGDSAAIARLEPLFLDFGKRLPISAPTAMAAG